MNSIMKATQKLAAGRVQLRNAAAAAVAPAGTPLQRENILERLRKREERMRLKRGRVLLDAQAGLRTFEETLAATGTDGLMYRVAPKTIQVNIGLLCNQSCHHCHVESSPERKLENMGAKEVARIVELVRGCPSVETVDITGGAPEMNPHFKTLVREIRALGLRVVDRCNLTVLSLDGQEELQHFLAENQVAVVASMPCYTPDNVNAQRGDGVFDASIAGLEKLNAVGYGSDPNLTLDLVYNPGGAFLPGPQAELEAAYKKELKKEFDLVFNNLFTITNLPIKRFADDLKASGKLAEYMSLLVASFNPAVVESLMCRDTISISWTGSLHDCDFNQQLGMPLGVHTSMDEVSATADSKPTIWNIDSFSQLTGTHIGLGPHCYGCTAGSGSSCGGSLEQ